MEKQTCVTRIDNWPVSFFSGQIYTTKVFEIPYKSILQMNIGGRSFGKTGKYFRKNEMWLGKQAILTQKSVKIVQIIFFPDFVMT